MELVLIILSLPTENATVRQRVWRALKAMGAACLRDGVYALPAEARHRAAMQEVEAGVLSGGGTAHVFASRSQNPAGLLPLFDRSAEYGALIGDIEKVRRQVDPRGDGPGLLKKVRKLRRSLSEIASIDFFPGPSQAQAGNALSELEHAVAQVLTPGEPHAASGAIQHLRPEDYRGRHWATRQRPWVDRLASAWLIRRFIDPDATILWLATPGDCPAQALGFDFDGATFSHIGERVTFQVLLASFGLEQPALNRLGQVVQYLDVGGTAPLEAQGVEAILSGLRATAPTDDALLSQASLLFDGLLAHFCGEATTP